MKTLIADGYDIVECAGVKISAELFHYFAHQANVGKTFRFESLKDGVVTVSNVDSVTTE